MSGPSNPVAVVFGEVVIDVYPDAEVPAGAALHVAAHLAARGWKAHLVTRLGDDDDGALLMELFERHSIETSFVEHDARLPTGRATIHTSGHENRFTVHGPAAWDAIEGPAEPPEHDALCYGTLAARSERSRATLERLLASSGAPWKVLDVNLRPPDVARDVVEMTLGAATAVKLGEQELIEVAELLGIPADAQACFDMASQLRLVCITRGERGATLFERSGASFDGDARKVDIVNTVGAGDAFTAGLIEGVTKNRSLDEVLRGAQACAASILAKPGGLPDVSGAAR
ncbi:MAG: carbohydrate kinase family protein [Actinomycetota bacterium]